MTITFHIEREGEEIRSLSAITTHLPRKGDSLDLTYFDEEGHTQVGSFLVDEVAFTFIPVQSSPDKVVEEGQPVVWLVPRPK